MALSVGLRAAEAEQANDGQYVKYQDREHDVVEQVAVEVAVLFMTGQGVEHRRAAGIAQPRARQHE